MIRPDLRVNSRLSGVEIHFAGLVGLGTLDNLPSKEEDEEDRNTNVGSEEVGDIEVALSENGKVAEDQNKGEIAKCEPSGIWL